MDTKHMKRMQLNLGGSYGPGQLCRWVSLAFLGLALPVSAKETPGGESLGQLSTLQLHVATPQSLVETQSCRLQGADARQQILATAQFTSGAVRDYTRQVVYAAAPEGVVEVTKSGLVIPRGDGSAVVTARSSEGASATMAVTVEQAKIAPPINFANQIVPVFTKNGCNGGGCHGKSSGQNGFKLSLLGFEPGEDYEHLVKEARGRRLFPAAPERSLLLLKGAATLPHGGGRRLKPESEDYKLLPEGIP